METLDFLIDGFKVALTLENFTLALIGCISKKILYVVKKKITKKIIQLRVVLNYSL